MERRQEESGIEAAVREAVLRHEGSRTELAERAGVHRVNLSKFMGGGRGLSPASLEKVAAAVGYTIALVRSKRARKPSR